MVLIAENDYCRYTTKFYLKEQRGSHTVLIGYDGEFLIETVLDNIIMIPENEIKPLLTVPMSMANVIMKAFADKAMSLQINTENENHLKGKLDATVNHLKDMQDITRKLLDMDK